MPPPRGCVWNAAVAGGAAQGRRAPPCAAHAHPGRDVACSRARRRTRCSRVNTPFGPFRSHERNAFIPTKVRIKLRGVFSYIDLVGERIFDHQILIAAVAQARWAPLSLPLPLPPRQTARAQRVARRACRARRARAEARDCGERLRAAARQRRRWVRTFRRAPAPRTGPLACHSRARIDRPPRQKRCHIQRRCSRCSARQAAAPTEASE